MFHKRKQAPVSWSNTYLYFQTNVDIFCLHELESASQSGVSATESRPQITSRSMGKLENGAATAALVTEVQRLLSRVLQRGD